MDLQIFKGKGIAFSIQEGLRSQGVIGQEDKISNSVWSQIMDLVANDENANKQYSGGSNYVAGTSEEAKSSWTSNFKIRFDQKILKFSEDLWNKIINLVKPQAKQSTSQTTNVDKQVSSNQVLTNGAGVPKQKADEQLKDLNTSVNLSQVVKSDIPKHQIQKTNITPIPNPNGQANNKDDDVSTVVNNSELEKKSIVDEEAAVKFESAKQEQNVNKKQARQTARAERRRERENNKVMRKNAKAIKKAETKQSETSIGKSAGGNVVTLDKNGMVIMTPELIAETKERLKGLSIGNTKIQSQRENIENPDGSVIQRDYSLVNMTFMDKNELKDMIETVTNYYPDFIDDFLGLGTNYFGQIVGDDGHILNTNNYQMAKFNVPILQSQKIKAQNDYAKLLDKAPETLTNEEKQFMAEHEQFMARLFFEYDELNSEQK